MAIIPRLFKAGKDWRSVQQANQGRLTRSSAPLPRAKFSANSLPKCEAGRICRNCLLRGILFLRLDFLPGPITFFLDAGSWMLDTGYWMLDAGYWMNGINRCRHCEPRLLRRGNLLMIASNVTAGGCTLQEIASAKYASQ